MFRTTLKRGVTVPSMIFISVISLVSILFPSLAEALLNTIKNFIFVNLNWVYVWAATIFVIFLVYLMFSRYGTIRLGSNDSRPEFSFFSWVSMLFAAGMGIGLMYFGLAEPMQHYSSEVFASDHVVSRAKSAQLYTFFHWGVHAWAIYALIGLSLAYFAYRYNLPLPFEAVFTRCSKKGSTAPGGTRSTFLHFAAPSLELLPRSDSVLCKSMPDYILSE